MRVPTLTVEQRTVSLTKAAEARKTRSVLLGSVRAGKTTLPELLARSTTDVVARKTKVSILIKALPGFSVESAATLIKDLRIPNSRTIGGLNMFQREALIAATSRQ